jgi:Domain of unknown function (DUF3576).
MKKTALLTILFITAFSLASCNIYKRSDVKDNPVTGSERVKKNLEEGRGVSFKKLTGQGSGSFDFASSNELWRASIDILDFVTFANASYSGGILITDWFNSNSQNDQESNRELKITVRFLSNEIRADGIDVSIHERTCSSSNSNSCIIKKVKSNLEGEIKLAILKRATKYKKDFFKKRGEEERKKNPGKWKFLDDK